jgi:NAD+ diphosphatase
VQFWSTIILSYYGSYPDLYPYKGVSYSIIGVVFTGRIGDDQALQPTEELTEYMFRKLADVPIEEFAFPSMQQLFRDVQASKA